MFATALLTCAILLALSLLHFYWAFGGSYAKAGAIPSSANGKPVLSPRPLITAAVGVALLAMAGLVGAAAGMLPVPVPPLLVKVPTGLLAAVFFARGVGDFRYVGFFKSVKGSLFARRDTYFYAPLCIALAAMMTVVAVR